MKIHIGTSGYGYKEWKGRFYPEKIAARDMLPFYAARFCAVEINNTFYRMPTTDALEEWAGQVPDGFVFAFKAPRIITHIKRMKAPSEIEHLFNMLSVLGPKLGPVLFQFPEKFAANPDRLREFLPLLPAQSPCAFAFRNASWHSDEVLGMLRENGRGLCLEDTDEDPVDHITSTASWGYFRLRRSNYTDADLSRWAHEILSQDWGKAFVFFKHEEEARGPEVAGRFSEIVGPSR